MDGDNTKIPFSAHADLDGANVPLLNLLVFVTQFPWTRIIPATRDPELVSRCYS